MSFLLKNNSIQRKNKKNYKIVSKKIDEILKQINIKKNSYHSLSKKFSFDIFKKKLNKYKKFNTIVIIGMGGSILGSQSIYNFLSHKIKRKFIFIDNLDGNRIKSLKSKIHQKKTLFIIISKSGNTLETLTIVDLLRKFNFNESNALIITEKKKSALYNFCIKKNIQFIEHKKYIGGRYSVLSEVGMIPAYFMNLNLRSFRKNLLKYFKPKYKKILINNILFLADNFLSRKFNSIIFLNYSPQLNNFSFWCQQLIAESLGKKKKGLLPMVSSAPKDHHSLLQLYLDGPRDKIFVILSDNCEGNLKIKKSLFQRTPIKLNDKKLNKIINSQKKALTIVLKNKKIPFKEIEINKFSEETIGELFAYFILETSILGKLINVNPFDQPAVEEVKKITKKLLN
jgi:glucose-6-phosphate isomerase